MTFPLTFGPQRVSQYSVALLQAKIQWSQPEQLSRRAFRRAALWQVSPRKSFVGSGKTPVHNS